METTTLVLSSTSLGAVLLFLGKSLYKYIRKSDCVVNVRTDDTELSFRRNSHEHERRFSTEEFQDFLKTRRYSTGDPRVREHLEEERRSSMSVDEQPKKIRKKVRRRKK